MKTYITEYTIKRLPSSRNGNPRYELYTIDGEYIGATRPDSSIAYGAVPNNAERGKCLIQVHETKTGRCAIDSVEKTEIKPITE